MWIQLIDNATITFFRHSTYFWSAIRQGGYRYHGVNIPIFYSIYDENGSYVGDIDSIAELP